jgi:hypothetical protein
MCKEGRALVKHFGLKKQKQMLKNVPILTKIRWDFEKKSGVVSETWRKNEYKQTL